MAEEADVIEQEQPTAEVENNEAEQVEQKEDATNSDNAEDTGEPKPERKDKGVGKRINELTREKYEALRLAEHYKQLAESSQGRQTQQQAAPSDGIPTPDKFETFEDYQAALVDYRLEQRLAEREAKTRHIAQQESLHQQRVTWAQREEAVRDEVPDYDEVVYGVINDPVVANHPGIGEALAASEVGAKVLYFLGQNPQEARRIASLSPPAAAKEIGRIEAKILDAPKKTSAAPPPPKPVHGSAKAMDGLNDDLSHEEWLRRRNAQVYGNRRR